MKYYTASARFAAIVDVMCELCGMHYTIRQEFYFSTPPYGMGSPQAAEEFVQSRMKPVLEGLRAGQLEHIQPKRCPQCSYVQTWMIRQSKMAHYSLLASVIVLVGFGGLLALGYLIGEAPGESSEERALLIPFFIWAAALVAGLAIVARVVPKAYDPNRRILAGREAPKQMYKPIIRIEPHSRCQDGHAQ